MEFPGKKLFINIHPIWIILIKIGMLCSLLSYLICFTLLYQFRNSWAYPMVVADVSLPLALATVGITFGYLGISDIFVIYDKYVKFYWFPIAKWVPSSRVDKIKLIYNRNSRYNHLYVTVDGRTKKYYFENKLIDSLIEFAEMDTHWNEKIEVVITD